MRDLLNVQSLVRSKVDRHLATTIGIKPRVLQAILRD